MLIDSIHHAVTPYLHQAEQIVIGFSGGLDSTVLLHACVKGVEQYHLALSQAVSSTQDLRSQRLPQLTAVYVNHQLSSHASDWASHCKMVCKTLDIAFAEEKVTVDCNQASLEATARAARYQALSTQMTSASSLLMTGHHLDDQAETLLLRLLRGAGLKGLRAIHGSRSLAEGKLVRPLLGFSREQLLMYAQAYDLTWIEDESNQNLELDRNYIRHDIMPRLQTRWGKVAESFSLVAAQATEQQALLDEVAKADWLAVYQPDGFYGPYVDFTLPVARDWSLARKKNAVGYWLSSQSLACNREQWRQLGLVLSAESGKEITIIFSRDALIGSNEQQMAMRFYDAKLYLCDLNQLTKEHHHRLFFRPSPNDTYQCLSSSDKYQLNDAPPAPLGDGVYLEACMNKDVQSSLSLDTSKLTVLPASQFASARVNGKTQRIKKMFQTARIPAWLRSNYPVVCYEGRVVCAPRVFIADEFAIRDQEINTLMLGDAVIQAPAKPARQFCHIANGVFAVDCILFDFFGSPSH